MGLRDKLDTLVHGGVQQPASHERKKNYELGEVLGNWCNTFAIWLDYADMFNPADCA